MASHDRENPFRLPTGVPPTSSSFGNLKKKKKTTVFNEAQLNQIKALLESHFATNEDPEQVSVFNQNIYNMTVHIENLCRSIDKLLDRVSVKEIESK